MRHAAQAGKCAPGRVHAGSVRPRRYWLARYWLAQYWLARYWLARYWLARCWLAQGRAHATSRSHSWASRHLPPWARMSRRHRPPRLGGFAWRRRSAAVASVKRGHYLLTLSGL